MKKIRRMDDREEDLTEDLEWIGMMMKKRGYGRREYVKWKKRICKGQEEGRRRRWVKKKLFAKDQMEGSVG